jgi:hypothetical protein
MNKIITSIAAIMRDVGSVKKDGENKFHNYKYATASDILHKLQPLLAREGLVIFQNEVERDLIGSEALLAVKYEFTLAHKDGDIWPDRPKYTGTAAAKNTKGGYDDKALNKCHTAARKYFMLALFQIPTGDYDDADEQEDRISAKTKPKLISEAQRARLLQIADELDADLPQYLEYLSVRWEFDVLKLADIPADHFDDALATLERKRVKHDPETGEVSDATP